MDALITDNKNKLTFGPVPSRRLGKSLGINNIPPKICSYSCIYCQVGKTLHMQTKRKAFYKAQDILKNVDKKIKVIKEKKEIIDYLTFVSDGEPTLDINLKNEIQLLKKFGLKIAVISNSSLIWQKSVQETLKKADWVSLKIDAVSENIWRKINRPHKSLNLNRILQSITEFSKTFKGELTTETMLIRNLNDKPKEIKKIADFIKNLKVSKSYLSIPTRPPAVAATKPSHEKAINTAFQIFKKNSINTEYLIGYEGNAFANTGHAENDFLSIISVHPMREDAVFEFFNNAHADLSTIKKLLNENKIVCKFYNKHKFYLRKPKR